MKTHNYEKYASSYAKLGIQDTFILAYRDIPVLIEKYVKGKNALDFGCGAGRSTRFLKNLGMDAIGVDHNASSIKEARKLDPDGNYLLINENDFKEINEKFDLILIPLVMKEVESLEKMRIVFFKLSKLLNPKGVIIIVTDAEEMYKHETISFTFNFPQNLNIKSGDKVKLGIPGTDIVFYDYYWKQSDYESVFRDIDLKVIGLYLPLATGNEPYDWISETEFPPFSIYVLSKE